MRDFLQTYTVTLTALSPVHVGMGPGGLIRKSEYCYFPDRRKVYILNREKFFNFLLENRLSERYEEFVFGPDPDLAAFLRKNGFGPDDAESMALYSADPADALTAERSLKDIRAFMRDSQSRAFIPGSSLKGALRTALLVKRIAENPDSRDFRFNSKFGEQLPKRYFNVLNVHRNRDNAVNDILRTVSVSDSEVIPNDAFILCGKRDISPDGRINSVNTVRECIKPGTRIRFALTTDKSAGRYVSVDEIRDAVAYFAEYYRRVYFSVFRGAGVSPPDPDTLYPGGGSGYFSKNIVYPLLGRDRALREVSRSFKKHHHENDLRFNISPRKLKCTVYRGSRYEFGRCRLEISDGRVP